METYTQCSQIKRRQIKNRLQECISTLRDYKIRCDQIDDEIKVHAQQKADEDFDADDADDAVDADDADDSMKRRKMDHVHCGGKWIPTLPLKRRKMDSFAYKGKGGKLLKPPEVQNNKNNDNNNNDNSNSDRQPPQPPPLDGDFV